MISPALETADSLKCTTAQLHINFDCQFVACAGRCFELPLKMKANLVHSVSTADRCGCLFASGTIKGCQTIIYSIDLNHAGLSIMYNLSYNTSQDTTPSQLHFNLPLFFSVCLHMSVVNVSFCKGESLLCPAVIKVQHFDI